MPFFSPPAPGGDEAGVQLGATDDASSADIPYFWLPPAPPPSPGQLGSRRRCSPAPLYSPPKTPPTTPALSPDSGRPAVAVHGLASLSPSAPFVGKRSADCAPFGD